jgi:hypothetical protein
MRIMSRDDATSAPAGRADNFSRVRLTLNRRLQLSMSDGLDSHLSQEVPLRSDTDPYGIDLQPPFTFRA